MPPIFQMFLTFYSFFKKNIFRIKTQISVKKIIQLLRFVKKNKE